MSSARLSEELKDGVIWVKRLEIVYSDSSVFFSFLNDLRGQPNVNFYGGRYDVEVLKSPKILYRAGDQSNLLGQWFTESAPHSEIEVRINTAVKPIWTDRSGNYTGSSPLNTVYEIKIPAGTTIYRGPVASQGGIYQGGLEYEQIFIETPWKIEGVEVISSKPLN